MTQPTQAQIEAAANAMIDQMFAPHELPIDGELWCKYFETAKAALTAAAQVGEPDITTRRYMELKEENYRLQDIEEATIERCAQVALEVDGGECGYKHAENIAAAIRKFGDAP